MSHLARCFLAALALAIAMTAAFTVGPTAPAAAETPPYPRCKTMGDVRNCLHEDGTYTTEYVGPSRTDRQDPSGNPGGGRPATPRPPECRTVTVAATSVCECDVDKGDPVLYVGTCDINPNGDPSGPSGTQIGTTVTRAAATLRLPDGTPQVAPDPQANEWKMLVVNFNIWLTTSAPKTVSTTVTQNGITIRLKATRGKTTFDMGEKDVQAPTVTCMSMAPRPANLSPHDQPSPDCGYVYRHHGVYTIAATTTWKIAWSAAGLSGTLTTSRTAAAPTPLTIGELVSVIVGVGPDDGAP